MSSLGEKLLLSLEDYVETFRSHPFIRQYPYTPDTKRLIYERFYQHVSCHYHAYNYLWKRAAEFAPTTEAKDYLLKVFDKSEDYYQRLLCEAAKEFDLRETNNATCMALQMHEWHLILNKKDVPLFLASNLGAWRLTAVIIETTSQDLNTDFSDLYDYKALIEWIDRLAPKDWSQEYFEELRDVCLRLLVLEMPAKYDYLYNGINSLPNIQYFTPNFKKYFND